MMKLVLIVVLTIVAVHQIRADQPKECLLPPFKGPCQLELVRWYNDSKSGKCKKFIYGGCQTNGNMFKTKLICRKYCAKDDDS